MATHSSVLAWRIPGTGEPGGLPSLGSHRVGHYWSGLTAADNAHIHKMINFKKKKDISPKRERAIWFILKSVGSIPIYKMQTRRLLVMSSWEPLLFWGELKKNTQELSRHEAWIIKICTPDCVITPQNWRKSLLKWSTLIDLVCQPSVVNVAML